MAYNEELADRVRDALAHHPKVEPKRMFRGVAFMVDGKMCINVIGDELMCRIDPAEHDALVEVPGCRSMEMKGRALKGWVLVSPERTRTNKGLTEWVTRCLAFNKVAKASKKKKRS